MSFSFNRVLLAGNLTRDPEVRVLSGDKSVASFGLAVNRKFKSNDGQLKEEVTFVDIEAWGRTAELVGQYLTKGRGCFVEGRLKLDSWDDKESGQKRSKLKIVAESVQFTGGAPGSRGDGAAPASRPSAGVGAAGSVDEEAPFMRIGREYQA